MISVKPSMDMGDVVQIARAEGKKLFHGEKVRVVDAFHTSRPEEWVAVVESSEIPEKRLK